MVANQKPVLEARQLNDADKAILDELQEGRATPGYLSGETDVEQTYINQRLKRLEEHGHVDRLARGLWELVDDPREDSDVEFLTEEEHEERRTKRDLRGRLQDALEARDDQQARAERLAEDLEDCREQLEQARESASVDAHAAAQALDDMEAALERGARHSVQEALQRAREALDHAE